MVDYRSDLTLGDLRAILAAQAAFQLVDRRRFRPSHDIEDDGLMRVVPETMSSNRLGMICLIQTEYSEGNTLPPERMLRLDHFGVRLTVYRVPSDIEPSER